MKTLEQVLSEMSPENRKTVRARADEMIAEHLTLQQLRKAHQKTQTEVAKVLGMTQDQVSRIEQRSDLLLSTLRKFVEGMGGRLSLVAEFPSKAPVRLTGFAELGEPVSPARRVAGRPAVSKRPGVESKLQGSRAMSTLSRRHSGGPKFMPGPDQDLIAPSLLDCSCSFPTSPTNRLLRQPSGVLFLTRPELSSDCLRAFRPGDNHLRIHQAQQCLNMYIGGYGQLWPWRYEDGKPWLKLPENGFFCSGTHEAVKRYQRHWRLPEHGLLCPLTRAMLRPVTLLRGSLWRKGGFAKGNSGAPGMPPSKVIKVQPTNVTPRLNVTGPTTGSLASNIAGAKKKESGWKVEVSVSEGGGASGPIYTGKSSTNTSVKPDSIEVDNKVEVEAALSTPLVIGGGHVKLSVSGEWDKPVDANHNQSTLAGNFKLEADDAIKLGGWGTLSPYVQGSEQWKFNPNKQSTAFKGGVELSIDLIKDRLSLKADANSGVQLSGKGADPKTDAHLVVPWEGNVGLELKFP